MVKDIFEQKIFILYFNNVFQFSVYKYFLSFFKMTILSSVWASTKPVFFHFLCGTEVLSITFVF